MLNCVYIYYRGISLPKPILRRLPCRIPGVAPHLNARGGTARMAPHRVNLTGGKTTIGVVGRECHKRFMHVGSLHGVPLWMPFPRIFLGHDVPSMHPIFLHKNRVLHEKFV